MYLRQVENAIFHTECGRLLRDGMCCSEPIMTRDEKGIIDHFFVYCEDTEEGTFLGPIDRFGIYAEKQEHAYMAENKGYFSLAEDEQKRFLGNTALTKESYDNYSALYGQVREFVMTECTEQQREILQNYLHALREVVDEAMLFLYRELAPEFFMWADSQTAERY